MTGDEGFVGTIKQMWAGDRVDRATAVWCVGASVFVAVAMLVLVGAFLGALL